MKSFVKFGLAFFPHLFFVWGLLVLFASCERNSNCDVQDMDGTYTVYIDGVKSEYKMEIYSTVSGFFRTNGIGGAGKWYPTAPLSGRLGGCKITINSYNNVKREGLPYQSGCPRYYYESMSGEGEFFSKGDSIRLFLTYKRAGFMGLTFDGVVRLVKDQ